MFWTTEVLTKGNGMDDVIVWFLIVLAILAGIFLGIGIEYQSWKKDCEQVGIHRSGDDVYTCAKK